MRLSRAHLWRFSRGSTLRLRSADYDSDHRILLFLGGVGIGIMYLLAGELWWSGALLVGGATALRWRRDRASLLADRDHIVPVVRGVPGDPVWWEAVDSMFIARRPPPPWTAVVDSRTNQPAYVIVVLLKTGEEQPLWEIAAGGARTAIADPQGRTEALLETLQALHRPSTARLPSKSVQRPTRVRPPDHWRNFAANLLAAGVTFATSYWLGLPWWAGGVVASLFTAYGLRKQRWYLLVDDERMVSVAAGIRGKSVWWDTIDSMYIGRQTPPFWAPGALPDSDELAHIIIVRLNNGDEIPLWAISAVKSAGGDSSARTEQLLHRLEALQPVRA